MKRHNFILALLIAIVIGFSAQQTFAQKTSKIGKKGKMIEFQPPPPKELFVEMTVIGSGNYNCFVPGKTCTWKIDRKYSATIVLDKFRKETWEYDSEPGAALAIAQSKIAAKAKAKPAAAFNSVWHNILTDPMKGSFDVEVSINDEMKEKWKVKNKGIEEEKFILKTWKTAKTPGRNSLPAEVILDRKSGQFRIAVRFFSDAEMVFEIDSSGEDPLPIRLPVFDTPYINSHPFSDGYVTIPFDGIVPDEKTASFNKTFSDLKTRHIGEGFPPEANAATITVTYKFGNKGTN